MNQHDQNQFKDEISNYIKDKSDKDVIDILNRHPAYEEFRVERTKQLNSGVINYSKLVNGLKAWSTNDQYSIIILDKIKSLNAKK